LIVDLFAGIGGWTVALRNLGLVTLGIEIWDLALATRTLNGFDSLQADVSKLDPRSFHNVKAIVGSPPCQDWSISGYRKRYNGDTGPMVDEPLRWITELQPEWFAFEQTPLVRPTWIFHDREIQHLGYASEVVNLWASDYGVPQRRKRTIWAGAKWDWEWPTPVTNVDISMVGIAPPGAAFHRASLLPTRKDFKAIPVTGPCRTCAFGHDFKSWHWCKEDGTFLSFCTLKQALKLQGFPDHFALAPGGNKLERSQLVGNAVPPPMVQAVIQSILDSRPHELP
jgi:site-specific DNA-cytosine methylase